MSLKVEIKFINTETGNEALVMGINPEELVTAASDTLDGVGQLLQKLIATTAAAFTVPLMPIGGSVVKKGENDG